MFDFDLCIYPVPRQPANDVMPGKAYEGEGVDRVKGRGKGRERGTGKKGGGRKGVGGGGKGRVKREGRGRRGKRLFPFPTQKKDREKRERWKQLVGRAGQGKKLWSPSKDSRICSNHFIDGQPTVDNPYPTLNLGYDGYKDRVRRITLFGTNKAHELQCYKTKIVKQSQHGYGPDTSVEDPPLGNLPRRKGIFEFVWPWIVWVINLIIQLVDAKRKTTALQNENEELRATIKKLKTEKLKVSMDSDEDVNFHTAVIFFSNLGMGSGPEQLGKLTTFGNILGSIYIKVK
ncbi:hypothetical protein FSP39_020520 [Pinctada imbricata]|uniref:THAP-type domain-containing protein n=1 Tax=Pinctada imbricata TaxID=66713 RepID=A0AA88XQH0_PINIB|nr:hypothetical protein FSP39_020520 [Pinctada imbricata]